MARLDNRTMVIFIFTLLIAIMLLGCSRESSSQIHSILDNLKKP
jgi:hypothetical protein